MIKFETSWREDFKFYERVFNTELNKSMKKEVKSLYEWYEPSSNGIYTSVIDSSIRLEKKQSSSSKDGRDKYGFLDPMYRNIRDSYWNKDLYNLEPRTFFIDIETRVGQNSNGFPVPEKALEEICLMQFFDSTTKTMFVLGNRAWKHQDNYKFDYIIKYVHCKDEIEILNNFIKIFKALDPLIIYAWNGNGFDYPYIHNRMKNLGLNPNDLSNYGKVHYSQREFQGRLEFSFSSDGHHFIDLMEIYKKFVFKPRPSYSLETIANIELGDKKVSHTEYEKFDGFYSSQWYTISDEPYIDQPLREEIRQLQIKRKSFIDEFNRRNIELP